MSFWDFIIIFFAQYLGWVLGIFLLFFVWLKKREGVFIVGETLTATIVSRFGLTEIIRYFYDKPRPFEGLEGAKQLVEHDAGGSFPSGNAAFFFAIATTLFIYNRRWGVVFFVAAILMGAARVFANLHWPIDILGGAAVGIISSLLAHFLAKKFKKS